MNDFKALVAWVSENEARFTAENYTKDEIATLAIACGFDRQAVAQWKTQESFRKVVA